MSDTEHDKIVAKIRKLMAKANDPSVTEAEAAAYAAKVNALLAEHRLVESDVKATEDKAADTMGSQRMPIKYNQRWRRSLMNAVGKYYGCFVLISTNRYTGKAEFLIFGRETSRFVCIEMYSYLEGTIKRLAQQYSSQWRGDPAAVKKAWYEFEKGAGVQMSSRLHSMVPKKDETSGNLPVLLADYDAAQAAAREQTSFKDGRKSAMRFDYHGMMGAEAANGISMNDQVGGPRKSSTLLIG